ncbi:hypothetical protein [Henriciella litoralis]|uniref:hypothetical protein n=1 Tax=Henriciella litoralis TaxID=568102 RepID=UPI00111BDCFA|nr:hypothetical protein [Henriciella litoralis]
MMAGLGAFLISRPVGDFAFLMTSLILVLLAASSPRQRSILAAAGVASIVSAGFLLTNAVAALYVRGPILGLTEPASLSALNGIVYLLILPVLVLVGATLGAIFQVFCKPKKIDY